MEKTKLDQALLENILAAKSIKDFQNLIVQLPVADLTVVEKALEERAKARAMQEVPHLFSDPTGLLRWLLADEDLLRAAICRSMCVSNIDDFRLPLIGNN